MANDRAATRVHESGHAFVSALFQFEIHDYQTGILPPRAYNWLDAGSGFIEWIAKECETIAERIRHLSDAISMPNGHVIYTDPRLTPFAIDVEHLLFSMAGPCAEISQNGNSMIGVEDSLDWQQSVEMIEGMQRWPGREQQLKKKIREVLGEFVEWYAKILQQTDFSRGRICVENFFSDQSFLERLRMQYVVKMESLLPHIIPYVGPVMIAGSTNPSLCLDAAALQLQKQKSELTAGLYEHLRKSGYPQGRLEEMGKKLTEESAQALDRLWEENATNQ